MAAITIFFRATNSSDGWRRANSSNMPQLFGAGDLYGTLVDEVAPRLSAGKWVVLEIDVEGTRAIVQKYPDAVTIFVRPASLEELERRLRHRGTETEAAIERRLQVARQEMAQAGQYQYQVTNQTVATAVDEILKILEK